MTSSSTCRQPRGARRGRAAGRRRLGRGAGTVAGTIAVVAVALGLGPGLMSAPGLELAGLATPVAGHAASLESAAATGAASGHEGPTLTVAGPRAGRWSWPAPPPHVVTRPFDASGPYAAGHRGIDLAVPPGAVIVAPADGVVRFAGVVVDRPVLSIEHADGLVSSFEPVDALVAPGERVARGQAVATLSAAVVHAPSGGLHLGARLGGEYIDPRPLLAQPARAVLLPLERT